MKTPKTKKSEWLKRGSDWGAEYIALEPHDESGMASSSRALKVESGEMVDLLARDGTQLTLPVEFREHSSEVGDHGHTYPVRYKLPGVVVDLLGTPMWLPLDHFDVKRAWAKSRQP